MSVEKGGDGLARDRTYVPLQKYCRGGCQADEEACMQYCCVVEETGHVAGPETGRVDDASAGQPHAVGVHSYSVVIIIIIMDCRVVHGRVQGQRRVAFFFGVREQLHH